MQAKLYSCRMESCGMLRRVALIRNVGLYKRATRRNIPEDAILHSHRRENLKSYIIMYIFFWYIRQQARRQEVLN
jgi:hypothetical protein